MGVNFTRNQVAKEKQRIETTRPPGFAFPLGLTFGEQVVAGARVCCLQWMFEGEEAAKEKHGRRWRTAVLYMYMKVK